MTSLIPSAMLGVAALSFNIPNSASFASEDSPVLDRTFVLGDRKTWTLSVWAKRADVSTMMPFLTSTPVGGQHQRTSIESGGAAVELTWDGSAAHFYSTTGLFRDVAEWYHIVYVFDTTEATATDRNIVYVNGVIQPKADTNLYALNANGVLNQAGAHRLGEWFDGVSIHWYADGYMAEVHFVDGQALTPDDFAEENETTGQWIPKEYIGTYGTTGFYLNFQNGADLGEDSSGNANNFTATAVTQSTDTPTDNHCTWNVLSKASGVTLQDSALTVSQTTPRGVVGTMSVSSGKWYWEIDYISFDTNNDMMIGIADVDIGNGGSVVWYITLGGWCYFADGRVFHDGVGVSYGATYTSGDIIGVALDLDTGDVEFFKNNVSQGIAYTGLNTGNRYAPLVEDATTLETVATLKVTEDSWTYTPPSGFLALSAKNLPIPDIVLSENYFKVLAYDDGVGAKTVGFQPDLVWMKSRGSAFSHKLVDSVRGATKAVSADSTAAEVTESTGLTSFDVNGFTVGADTDYSDTTGNGMISWSWKEGVTPGFDVVSYTGDGTSARNISHGLGVVPEMMLVKNRSVALGWTTYHKNNHATVPENYYLALNTTASIALLSSAWNNTKPSSSVFTVGSSNTVNTNTDNYIAYLFTSIEGFSKVGSYIGNGSVDGPFVHCGFRPAFLLVKNPNGVIDWIIKNTGSDLNNMAGHSILPNINVTEFGPGNTEVDILSNGFKPRTASGYVNTSSSTYIFMAFAESPFQYSRSR